MQELVALHQQILALPAAVRPAEGIDFSKDEAGAEMADLPDALRTEIEAVRQAINALLPEDFDYFAFVGSPAEEASFFLEYNRMPAGSVEDDTLQAEGSLIEQLQKVDWDKQREKAVERRRMMDEILYMTEMLSAPLRSAKSAQREFREETKEFIKEKRSDATRIHLLYWDEEKAMMEADFADGAALREALPNLLVQEAEVIAIVAWGKPLPVERVDALKAEAQQALRERMSARINATQEESLQDEGDQATEPDEASK